MEITIFTKPNCRASMATRTYLSMTGISFCERDADTQNYAVTPAVLVSVAGQSITWEGHRTYLLDMLGYVFDNGLIPSHGLSDYDSAREAVLTRAQVESLVKQHQVAQSDFDTDAGVHPLYRGAEVLDWLGY